VNPLVQGVLRQLKDEGVVPLGICADTRKLAAGDLFVACPGYRTDGRQFLDAAVARGAAAVLCEGGDGFRAGALAVPALAVDGLRDLAGHLAHEIYRRPSERLWLAGVTGTNGKTTVSHWLAQVLHGLGVGCGVIGTLGCGFPGALAASLNTTPDALELHRMLAGFVASGAGAAVMEVSSIGLDQGRVNGACFDVAIFTNLSRDHLDYHGTMEAYAAAKAQLFVQPGLACSVINIDDDFGLLQARRLVADGRAVIAHTLRPERVGAVAGARMLFADRVHGTAAGLGFTLHCDGRAREVGVRMVGAFNVANLLAVIGALLARGAALEDILARVPALLPPQGRMQLVGGDDAPLVVVDYAHTPDALAKVLEAVRTTVRARQGRLVCVFGCGGDRDAGKRPLMGELASALADRVVITSDNPRSEDPLRIMAEVAAGAGAAAECLVGRAEAIRLAIGSAAAADVIVIAGKGHEPYQEIGGVRLPFSDLEQAEGALQHWRSQEAKS
jgi:UDP-N-acetylmuramoyl-L-alanyl-D-glutamate--2,6-diaminopimelate ligase